MLVASRNVKDKSKNKIQYKTTTHTLYSIQNQENKKSKCIYEIRHYKLIKKTKTLRNQCTHQLIQPTCNTALKLVGFVFPIEVPGELDPLSFHKLRVDMHVNKTKFERNSSLKYYHMTCIGKTKHTN